jgi:hypothetical protein
MKSCLSSIALFCSAVAGLKQEEANGAEGRKWYPENLTDGTHSRGYVIMGKSEEDQASAEHHTYKTVTDRSIWMIQSGTANIGSLWSVKIPLQEQELAVLADELRIEP